MNDDNVLGGVLNQLSQTAKKTVQQAVNLPDEKPKEEKKEPGSSQGGEAKSQPQWQSDEERIKFLKGLYAPTQTSPEPTAAKPDEQKKLLELRNQLHKQVYYDPTFNPVKNQEERPAEKVENEKKKEMQDLQQKEDKKPKPIAVIMEQNKAEQFRGAAG